MLRTLALVVVALVLAVAVGRWLSDDPGVVVIGLHSHVIRMSVATAATGLIMSVLLLSVLTHLAWRLITVRSRWRRWRTARRTRRNQTSLNSGLLALAGGDYARAERVFARASGDDVPPAHYLAAAQAAHAQGASARRDQYLALASDASPTTQRAAVLVQQIEMQLADGQVDAAVATLRELETCAPNQALTLRLQHRCAAATGNWEEVPRLLATLKKTHAYDAKRMTEIEAEAAARLLAQPHADLTALEKIWNALPKTTRSQPSVIAAYAQQLMGFEAMSQAENVLRKTIERQWDSRLVSVYGELLLEVPSDSVRHAESWLAEHGEDPALLLALGRLCFAAQLWGKARGYFESALTKHPSALVYRLLADVYERLDEPAMAARQRRLGLEFATNRSTAQMAQ